MVVAGHFEVTETVDFRFAARTGKFHRALPITGSDFRVAGNLLLRKFCFCVECESEFGHGNAPLNRIGRASGGDFSNGGFGRAKKNPGAPGDGMFRKKKRPFPRKREERSQPSGGGGKEENPLV